MWWLINMNTESGECVWVWRTSECLCVCVCRFAPTCRTCVETISICEELYVYSDKILIILGDQLYSENQKKTRSSGEYIIRTPSEAQVICYFFWSSSMHIICMRIICLLITWAITHLTTWLHLTSFFFVFLLLCFVFYSPRSTVYVWWVLHELRAHIEKSYHKLTSSLDIIILTRLRQYHNVQLLFHCQRVLDDEYMKCGKPTLCVCSNWIPGEGK